MFRRVKKRHARPDDAPPFLRRQFESMFTIDGTPDFIIGRFRIEDEPVEVEDQRFNLPGHSRQLYLRGGVLYFSPSPLSGEAPSVE